MGVYLTLTVPVPVNTESKQRMYRIMIPLYAMSVRPAVRSAAVKSYVRMS